MKQIERCLLKHLILGVCVSLAGCVTSPSKPNTNAIQSRTDLQGTLPKQVQINAALNSPAPFYGLPDLKQANERGASIMYMGHSGFEGVLLQIIAHAAVANELNNQKKLEAQEKANEVLSSYYEDIHQTTHHSLISSALSNYSTKGIKFSMRGDSAPEGNYVIVETLPTFYISQDEKAIVIRHHLKASLASEPEQVIYENVAKTATSQPFSETDNAGTGNKYISEDFEKTTQHLYSSTFKTLIEDLYGLLNESPEEKTFKYFVGEERFFERANLIAENCSTQTLRNLKGNILILKKSEEGCEPGNY